MATPVAFLGVFCPGGSNKRFVIEFSLNLTRYLVGMTIFVICEVNPLSWPLPSSSSHPRH